MTAKNKAIAGKYHKIIIPDTYVNLPGPRMCQVWLLSS